jgi:hypothetical protein
MAETKTSQKMNWWREIVTAFVVALVISTYYSAKLTRVQRRAKQVEMQLKQLELEFSPGIWALANVSGRPPSTLACPDGTKLHRVIDLTALVSNDLREDSEARLTTMYWQCVGKPSETIGGSSGTRTR